MQIILYPKWSNSFTTCEWRKHEQASEVEAMAAPFELITPPFFGSWRRPGWMTRGSRDL